MNLKDITKQAMQLSVAGFVNGEKFTEKRLRDILEKMLDKNHSKYIFEISMPDGRWFVKAIREEWGYDLIVPDTRKQEQQLIKDRHRKNR